MQESCDSFQILWNLITTINNNNEYFELLYSLGRIVGNNPWKTILIALLVSVSCFIGIIEFYDEKRQEKLWVASDSESLKHSEWVSNRYPPQSRIVTVIGEISNVLSPNGMKAVS